MFTVYERKETLTFVILEKQQQIEMNNMRESNLKLRYMLQFVFFFLEHPVCGWYKVMLFLLFTCSINEFFFFKEATVKDI